MKILDTRWFCGRTNVGIVRVDDEFDGIKYYIASVSGADESVDAEFIAQWGTTFPTEAGNKLFGIDPVASGDAVPMPVNKAQAECMISLGMHYLGLANRGILDEAG